MRLPLAFSIFLLLATSAFAAGRPMTVDDLLAVKSVADPQVSPDGTRVVYVVTEIDRATEKSNSDLWLIPAAGGEPRRLTTSPGADNSPRWSPDGKSIAFASTRGGSSQVWLLPLDEGGEARQITRLPIDASGPIWSPKGDRIAFVAEVYPGKTPEETAAKDKEKEASKSKAKVYDSLMVRHWASWDEGKKSHLFVVDPATGAATDLIPTWLANVPPAPFGGSSDYAFSPDGQELAFTSEPLKSMAWSTNSDIWTVPAAGGEPKNLTASNLAADAQPAYSPDGKFLAYVAQATEQYEADLWVLHVRDRKTGQTTKLGTALDRPVLSLTWTMSTWLKGGIVQSGDPEIYATIDDNGAEPIVRFSFETAKDGAIVLKPAKHVIVGGTNQSAQHDHIHGRLFFVRSSADSPPELYRADDLDVGRSGVKTMNSGPAVEVYKLSTAVPLTHHNAPLRNQLDLAKAEPFGARGAGGDEVAGWIIKPPGFDPAKKYPVLLLIHGGPQSAWHDEWVNRWNYGLFAAPGYVVLALNPRGSTGYGQKFTLQISKDWTGLVYNDLMLGLDEFLKRNAYADGTRVAAAGGSYGGFMVNWIAGHTDRFKCLISHAGVFDLVSMYGTTEELWFPEFEYGGPPWEVAKHYQDRSPSLFAQHFKTPTLVIHGALDFRVPDAQGLGMFTSLQRMGVPSKYLWFPDEGHWIGKPANRVVWWREMHAWLATYLK